MGAVLLGIVVAAFVVALAIAVERSDQLQDWLEDTAPLAPWLVAAGMFVFALATFVLARRDRGSAGTGAASEF